MSYFLLISRIYSLFIIGIFTVLSLYAVLLLFNFVYTQSIVLGINSDSFICTISTLSSNLIVTNKRILYLEVRDEIHPISSVSDMHQ